jgi:hypothetical protein
MLGFLPSLERLLIYTNILYKVLFRKPLPQSLDPDAIKEARIPRSSTSTGSRNIASPLAGINSV